MSNKEPDALLQLTLLPGHGPGFTTCAWGKDENESWCMLTAGADGAIVRRDSKTASQLSSTGTDNGSMYCMAASGSHIAVTDEQYLKLYASPSLEFQHPPVSRWTLPVRSVDFSADGKLIAAAGDDGLIKILELKTNQVLKQMKAEGYVRSLAFDPEGTFLAAMMADGTLAIWGVKDGRVELRKRMGPRVDPSSCTRSSIAWHPDGGTLLALPSTENDVVLLERLQWKPAAYLSGAHGGHVSAFAFSPNGVYAISGARDCSVAVWHVERATVLLRATCEQVPSSISWHPAANTVAIAGEEGGVGVWRGVVPTGMASSYAPLDEVLRAADRAATGGPADSAAVTGDTRGDTRGANGISADLMDELDDDDDDAQFTRRRRGDATGTSDANGDESDDDGGPRRHKRPRHRGGGGGGATAGAAPVLQLPRCQAAIASGSTPAGGEGGARFLAYNKVGAIIARSNDGHNTVEVVFHNSGRMRGRVPLLTDYYGFTLGALGDRGALYASPASSVVPAAMLVFRPFEQWAAHSDWSAALPEGEEVLCLASGMTFAAAATSSRALRLYSLSGVAMALHTLPGAPIALCASGHLLAVVWQGENACWENGSQRLQYAVHDVSRQVCLHSGPLVLSPGASLSWLSFSDAGLLASYDSKGVLRVRVHEFGGSWMPVFSAADNGPGAGEGVWPVAVAARQLLAVVTPAGEAHPAVAPRPFHTLLPLCVPVAAAEGGDVAMEGEMLIVSSLHSHTRWQAENLEGMDATQADAAALALQTEADRTSLKLMQAAMKGAQPRLARALELAGQLHLQRSLEAALKLANHHHHSALAERIAAVLELRMEWQELEEAAQGVLPMSGLHGSAAVTPIPMGRGEVVSLHEETGDEYGEAAAAVGAGEHGHAVAGGSGRHVEPLSDTGNKQVDNNGAKGPVASIFRKPTAAKGADAGGVGPAANGGAKRKALGAASVLPAVKSGGNPFSRVKK